MSRVDAQWFAGIRDSGSPRVLGHVALREDKTGKQVRRQA
jgi:hypothetical protein